LVGGKYISIREGRKPSYTRYIFDPFSEW